MSLFLSECDLGTLVDGEQSENLSPGFHSRPAFSLLPGQRRRQSGAPGVLWSLGLTESSLKDKKT